MAKKNELDKYKHLYRYSKIWQFISYYIGILHRLFYKNIIVEGTENIPDGYPLIFAPNHQNALMDPLAVNFACDKQIVFMARSDVFRDKFAIKALTFLKVLPVFRIRDGKDKLSNNDLTFDIAVRVLESKMHIGIFPEARHTDKRRLLGLKKGIPRLAFLAEERNDFKLNIKIVPVGIYYSKYNRMRSILHVRFGKPISVLDFKDEYLENQQKAMLSLRDAMSDAITPLIIDIRNSELYDTYESIRRLYVKNLVRRFKLGKLTQINKFKADKITIQAVSAYEKDNPEKMQDIKLKVEKYEDLKKKYKLSDQSVEKPYLSLFRIIINSFIILICIPPFIYGLAINLVPYFTPKILVLKFKDKQFHSSIKFAWAVLIIPIIYAIQIAILAIIYPNFWVVLAYAISLPVFGLLARVISEWISTLFEDWRLRKIRNFFPKDYKTIKELHKELILELDLIVTHWNRKGEN